MKDEKAALGMLAEVLDPSGGPPAELKTRAAAAWTSASPETPAAVGSRLSDVRRRWGGSWGLGSRLVVGVAAAALAAGGIFYGGLDGASPSGVVSGSSGAPEASNILLAAAYTASQAPALAPRPDQFVFVRSTVLRTPFEASSISNVIGSGQRLVWLSASGQRAGLLDDATNPSRKLRQGPVTLPANGRPAYRNDVPRDPEAALAFLYDHNEGGGPRDAQAFATVRDLIGEAYLPPSALSAVFVASARIPGVTETEHAVDAAGRSGVAVGINSGNVRQELIFDRKTHRFLGERVLLIKDVGKFPRGTVTAAAAATEMAIVDRPGDQP